MNTFHVDMTACRRCAAVLEHKGGSVYACTNGHTLFLNASPATGVVLFKGNTVLLLRRAIEPGKGMLDIPGGFCDGPETLEAAVARELEEEVGLIPADYTDMQFLQSGLDPYAYGGEVLPVLAAIFTARMTSDKQPVAADDAASAEWVLLSSINLKDVYFPAVRDALARLQSSGLPAQSN